MIALVLGGARSGKSRYAARVARELTESPVMLATSRICRRRPRGAHRAPPRRSRPRVDHDRGGPGHRPRGPRGARGRRRLRDAVAHEPVRSTRRATLDAAHDAARARARAPGGHRRDLDLRVQRGRHGAARGHGGRAEVRGPAGLREPGHCGARGRRRDAHGRRAFPLAAKGGDMALALRARRAAP